MTNISDFAVLRILSTTVASFYVYLLTCLHFGHFLKHEIVSVKQFNTGVMTTECKAVYFEIIIIMK